MVTPIPVGAFHVSRARFARTLDFQEVARNNDMMDRSLAQATDIAERFLKRGFYPWYGTRRFDWPNRDNPVNWRLRLDDDELIRLVSATAGSDSLSLSNVLPYPDDGPPYTWLETAVAGNDVFQSGDTWQDAIALTGQWGYREDSRTVATLVGTINTSVSTLVLSNAAAVSVGDVLLIDTEYLVIRDQLQVTTGQTLQTPITAMASSTAVAVTTGSAFQAGEVITLDAERMLVLDVAGNTLIVKRAWDGTVLATHTGSTIYAARQYTVDRAACGSTAASHTNGVTVRQHVIPAAVEALTMAEAGWLYANHAAGWQTAPGTTNRSTSALAGLEVIRDLRANARAAVGRKGRQRAV